MNETLFSQIQRLFERTYAQVGINLEDCLIDQGRCAQLSRLAGATARELSELARVGKNRVHQPRIIEHGIARFGVTEEIDQRHVIRLRPGQNANDKVEIRCRKARPTIRLDHRDRSISIARAGDKLAVRACSRAMLILRSR